MRSSKLEDELRQAADNGSHVADRTTCSARPSSSAFPIGSLLAILAHVGDRRPQPTASAAASWPRSNRSTPAPPSSKPTRPTTTRPTKTKTKRRRSRPASKRIMILGGGPNRIGQGIEFDYCCCHASFALRELGIESIMVNSNPETVSTDYDTSDLLFFEPLTTEDVLNICDRVQPDGVIVQFGGQTPLNLARAAGKRRRADHRHQRRHDRRRRRSRKVPAIAAAARPAAAGQRHRPHHGRSPRARPPRSAIRSWCGPSFVLGGRAMEICYDDAQLERFRGRGVHRRRKDSRC